MQLQNSAEDHHRSMMSTRSLPVDALGRLKHWWPSQAYHCTFCTRVFRTAQALGGHMNIHRRERACVSGPMPRLDATTTSPSRPPLFLTPASSSRSGLQPASQLHVSSFLTDHGAPRPGCNGGYGKLDLVADSPPQPRVGNSTVSDPLTWLFSQLPPPGSQTSNMVMQRSMVSKPYHRGLAVCKSPPGVRRHVCRIHTSPIAAQNVLYTGMMHSRSRGLASLVEHNNPDRISHGVHHVQPPEESALDLELRL